MHLAIACDHAGPAHKAAITAMLRSRGHTVRDFGTDSTASCDYADVGGPAAQAVASGECERGVLICGTGIGMSMVANKIAGIRCALAHSVATATTTAAHNKPQILAMGARIVDEATAVAMVEAWLDTPFEARHQVRIDKLHAFESC